MAKKASKKARKKPKTKKAKQIRRASAKRGRKPARAKKQPAKVASAFQIMIDTINETERLRGKNERRDVIDETG
jgi:hypothetical protein